MRYGHGHQAASREGSVRHRQQQQPISRDASVRRRQPAVPVQQQEGSVRSSGLRRTSSEPCIISAAGSASRAKQDSASSMHSHPHTTAPVDIGGKHASTGTVPANTKRPPRQRPSVPGNRQPSLAMAACATTIPARTNTFDAAGTGPERTVHLQQTPPSPNGGLWGGLSTALSKEESGGQRALRRRDSPKLGRESAHMQPTSDPVGSWGKRVAEFATSRTDSARINGSSGEGMPNGIASLSAKATTPGAQPLDPKALAAALNALHNVTKGDEGDDDATEGSGVLVVDSSLATEWPMLDANSGKSSSRAQDPTSPGDHLPKSSSGAAGVPTPASVSVIDGSSGSSGGPSDGSNSREWNARFVRRWKMVKQRARLQALGVRSIWKLNSPPNGEHHPPELLVNTIPSDSPRLSPEVLGAAQQNGGTAPAGATAAAHRHAIPRDPSLAAMLMGEVAEVC